MSPISAVQGYFDGQAFVYGPNQKIESYEKGYWARIKHFFGLSVWVDVQDQKGIGHRLFVPLSEVGRLFKNLRGKKSHGVGAAFAAALKTAHASQSLIGPSLPSSVQGTQPPSPPKATTSVSTVIENVTPKTPLITQKTARLDIQPGDGKAYICPVDKTGEKIEIVIRKTKRREGAIITFTAYGIVDGEEKKLGKVEMEPCTRQSNGIFGFKGSESDLHEFDDPFYYGPKSEGQIKVNQIQVNLLLSPQNRRYKGVGTALMQAAMEYSYAKKCDGRISLNATWNSFGFYYKLGMKTLFENINHRIKNNVEENDREGFYVEDSYHMYLTKGGIEHWKEKIKANPIFEKTKKYLGS